MKQPLASEIVKTYSQRGPMQQFRLNESNAFHCFRCGQSKKSKLLVTYDSDWDHLLCNGCYGQLHSIYEIKAGSQSEDEKSTELAGLLLSLYNKDQVQEAERLYQLSENRSSLLSGNALRFVATSEHLSQALESVAELDWSPATIGLCKAVETEVIERIVLPLSKRLEGAVIDEDIKEKDIDRDEQ